MLFYYALRSLASVLSGVRSTITSAANAIRNVWLLGDNLYTWLSSIATNVGLVVTAVQRMADDWLSVYNELKNAGTYVPGLSLLLYYLDDLLSLIRDFGYVVGQTLRARFPILYNFSLDPVSYVLEILYRYTGLSYNFVHNPAATITSIVLSSIGDLRNLITNPYAYIIGKLTQGNPRLYYLFISPATWLRLILSELSPTLMQFIDDPAAYIVDAFINGVERFLDRYGRRLAKVAEKIINAMF